jgi:hypothetical protein
VGLEGQEAQVQQPCKGHHLHQRQGCSRPPLAAYLGVLAQEGVVVRALQVLEA